MTNQPPPSPPNRAGISSPSLHSLFNFKDAATARDDADPLASLRRQLASLQVSPATPEQRAELRELIYTRSMAAIDALRASLTDTALVIPIAKATRRQIRSAQQLLRALSEVGLSDVEDAMSPSGQWEAHARTLWRSLHALAQHLLIGSLVAAPPTVGIWRQMHQLFATARRLGVSDYAPDATQATIKNVYFSAILLGCAQPAAFTSPEIAFIAAYLALYADEVELFGTFERLETADDSPPATAATFWIDPTRDTTAFACARKAAPPQTPVDYFCCDRLAARLARQLVELERGGSAARLDLPALADTPAGRGVLRRLRAQWGEPSKRRFPRRRQNYRAQLCAGLGRLWRLFQDSDEMPGDASNWMITNESPDGYALMHVAGKTAGLSVGDLTAMRTESGTAWQICIVRWALSENQEHLELGLQILATRGQPARLALPSDDSNPRLLSVLVLPTIGALRPTEMLIVPSSALGKLPDRLVLVVEKENIELREVKCHHLAESNSKIAILAIEPDTQPR